NHGAGQESAARQAQLDPCARHRRELRGPERGSRAGSRLPGRETRTTMNLSDWLAAVIVLICVLLSFFFAGSETALTASSPARMLRLEKQNNPRAATVNRLLQTRERLIGALLLGNNAVNVAASSLATGIFLGWFGDVGVVYATVFMTVLLVVF